MNVILTEQQFKNYINYLIESSFICEDKANGKTVQNFQDKIQNRVSNLLSKNSALQKSANRIGINPNYNPYELAKLRNKEYLNGGEQIDLNYKLKNELKSAAKILSKYVSPHQNARGMFDFKKLETDYPNDADRLLHIKEFLDGKGLTWLYDKNNIPDDKLTQGKRHHFGLSKKDTFDDRFDNFDLTSIGDIDDWDNSSKVAKNPETKILSPLEATIRMKTNFLDNYLDKVYGLIAKVPVTVFANGNEKLPESTLIINFSAAMQCPAWNECLLRNACYARKGEKQHPNVRNANVQRNLMWEAGHQDPELLAMMFQLIRLYCFDYDKALPKIKKILGDNETAESISAKHFSELDETVREILMKHKKIKHIRLNENGDFIGDWLINAFDKEAGDFKVMDILTSAYTCRNIKDENGNSIYVKVADIILNVSNRAIQSDTVARYFFAIDPKYYNAFDETYGGENNSLEIVNGSIHPNPQPLYNVDENGQIYDTGYKYYKCPCARKKPNNKDENVSCYECNVCYEPNTVSDKPYYVLVQTHSNGAKEAQGIHMHGDIPQFGFSRNYLKRLGIQPSKQKVMVAENKETLHESVNRSLTEGVLQVARNCVNSIKSHLNNLATSGK